MPKPNMTLLKPGDPKPVRRKQVSFDPNQNLLQEYTVESEESDTPEDTIPKSKEDTGYDSDGDPRSMFYIPPHIMNWDPYARPPSPKTPSAPQRKPFSQKQGAQNRAKGGTPGKGILKPVIGKGQAKGKSPAKRERPIDPNEACCCCIDYKKTPQKKFGK